MGNEFKQSNCVSFVQFLKQVRIRGHNKNEKNKENYLTTYNGFEKVSYFTNSLHKQMQQCQNELLHLPLNQPKRNGREDYIVNLYKNLQEAKVIIETPKIEETLIKQYPYIYCGNEDKLKRFPTKFSREKHPSNIDYQNHKVHFMFSHHKQVIYHTINRIKFMSFDTEFLNTLILTNPCVSNEQNTIRESEAHPIYRCKTSLSVNQLAYLFDLIIGIVSNEPVNKKELAQLLSEFFETPHSKQPSSQQIYKSFYKIENSTKKIVKDIIFKMLKKVR